jgi:hypothetical protein
MTKYNSLVHSTAIDTVEIEGGEISTITLARGKAIRNFYPIPYLFGLVGGFKVDSNKGLLIGVIPSLRFHIIPSVLEIEINYHFFRPITKMTMYNDQANIYLRYNNAFKQQSYLIGLSIKEGKKIFSMGIMI